MNKTLFLAKTSDVFASRKLFATAIDIATKTELFPCHITFEETSVDGTLEWSLFLTPSNPYQEDVSNFDYIDFFRTRLPKENVYFGN